MRKVAFMVLILSISCSMLGCVIAVVAPDNFSHTDGMLTVMAFAIAVGAKQHNSFAGINVKTNAVQDLDCPIACV